MKEKIFSLFNEEEKKRYTVLTNEQGVGLCPKCNQKRLKILFHTMPMKFRCDCGFRGNVLQEMGKPANQEPQPEAGPVEEIETQIKEPYPYKKFCQFYFDIGLTPYPCAEKSKAPRVAWKYEPGTDLPVPPPDEKQIKAWASAYPSADIWVRLSDEWIIVEPDGPEAEKIVNVMKLPDTPIAFSGNKSRHRFFRNPNGKPLKPLKIPLKSGEYIEFRTGPDQGVVVPPATHPETGNQRVWERGWPKGKDDFAFMDMSIYEAWLEEELKLRPPPTESAHYDGKLKGLNIEKYLDEYGVDVWRTKRRGDSTLYLLRQCPWITDHTSSSSIGESSIIRVDSGKLYFQCFHSHCVDKTWSDFRQYISGGDNLSKFCEGYNEPDNQQHAEEKPEEIKVEDEKAVDIPFPKEAIGGVAGEYADLYSQYLESPWSYFAFSFLTFLGLLVSDKVQLATQTRPQTRIYTILIGQTGRARKSEAIAQTQDFFDCPLFDNLFKTCGGFGSAEGLIHWVSNNFSTENGLSRIIKKGVVIYDEFEAFVQKVKIESSTLSTAVRTLFRRNKYENQVKGTKDVQVEDLYLAILGACTQEVFQTMWESDHITGGTLNRFWLVKESTNKVIPIAEPIPPEKIEALRNKVDSMLNNLCGNKTFDIDREAKKTYSAWYIDQTKDTSDFAVRLEEYAERLALLLAFNRNQKTVDLKTIQDTIQLIKWQRQIREDCFPQIAIGIKARVEARIRNQVTKNAHAGITRGQIDHRIRASDFDTWIVENSYKGLEKAGHILLKKGRYFPGPSMPNLR